jgi:hypothetical protein
VFIVPPHDALPRSCLSCQPKCAGISCDGKPSKAADCPKGQVFRAPKNTNSDNPTQCSDCCGMCVPGSDPIIGGASSLSLALAALVATVVAAML